MTHLRALGAQGAIPWPIDPTFERLGVMNHELGHLYYFVAFPVHGAPWMNEVSAILMERPVSATSRYRKLENILQSPLRDEMLLPLATLFTMKNPGHDDDDNRDLGIRGGITIAGRLNPDTGADSARRARERDLPPPGGRYNVGVVFYEESRSMIDFLIEESRDTTIFRAITDEANGGRQMDDWLRREGHRHHLPNSITALDREWRAWMERKVGTLAG